MPDRKFNPARIAGRSAPSSRAGGIFIALGAVVGAAVGVIAGQPSIGLLAGLALGVVMALAIWWRGR